MRRALLIILAVIVVVGGGFGLWLITGPSPTGFAGGNTVALADYHAADPTGVPADLAHESLIKRGEYLTRAADCVASARRLTFDLDDLHRVNVPIASLVLCPPARHLTSHVRGRLVLTRPTNTVCRSSPSSVHVR